jgi:hypothetical protein
MTWNFLICTSVRDIDIFVNSCYNINTWPLPMEARTKGYEMRSLSIAQLMLYAITAVLVGMAVRSAYTPNHLGTALIAGAAALMYGLARHSSQPKP